MQLITSINEQNLFDKSNEVISHSDSLMKCAVILYDLSTLVYGYRGRIQRTNRLIQIYATFFIISVVGSYLLALFWNEFHTDTTL